MKYSERIGQKFGYLTIESVGDTTRKNRQYRTYFNCKCDCGKTKSIDTSCLVTGRTVSCGCKNKEKRMIKGEAAFNGMYRLYLSNAATRDLEFALTKEQVKEITSQNCYYCNAKPNNEFKGNRTYGNYIYNGIDRLDNNKGYVLDNVVPCCKLCNFAKGSNSVTEFLNLIQSIYQHRIESSTFMNYQTKLI